MRKISKWKKLRRVFKRKLLKPLLYATGASFVLYLAISSVITPKRITDQRPPHFLISRLTSEFDETEFMHMLLTIQEIRDLPEEGRELRQFVNGPFPGGCPKLLERRLNQMNWTSQAFLIRVKKMFALNEIYERITRMDETIAFLSQELNEGHLPVEMWSQIEILQTERNNLIGTEISKAEYEFMQKYNGIVIRLQQQNNSSSPKQNKQSAE